MAEKTLYQSHPSMFRNYPIWFILSIILIAAYGLGLLILLIWWLDALGTTLIVTDERVILRKGILAKRTSEVYHTDIRLLQVSQRVSERMFGVGTIRIASAGHAGIEIEVAGIPNPEKIKEIIDQRRRQKN